MNFNWRDFLDLAQFLRSGVGNYSQEAAFRSSVSRAYYSAFHPALKYANSNLSFNPPNDRSVHKAVRKCFQKNGMKDIADSLQRLSKWRNMCDYDDSVVNLNSGLVPNALTEADFLLKKFP